MNKVFINDSFTEAINNYLAHKDDQKGIVYNSFLVVCIRMLVIIYNETDILNPYTSNNAEILKSNLTKFGYSLAKVEEFFTLLDEYKKIEEQNKNLSIKIENPYFIDVQKILIDLFTLKRVNFGLTATDSRDFFDLLYTPGTSNVLRLSCVYLYSSNNLLCIPGSIILIALIAFSKLFLKFPL